MVMLAPPVGFEPRTDGEISRKLPFFVLTGAKGSMTDTFLGVPIAISLPSGRLDKRRPL